MAKSKWNLERINAILQGIFSGISTEGEGALLDAWECGTLPNLEGLRIFGWNLRTDKFLAVHCGSCLVAEILGIEKQADGTDILTIRENGEEARPFSW